jgi:hypothetical protein
MINIIFINRFAQKLQKAPGAKFEVESRQNNDVFDDKTMVNRMPC